MQSGTRNLRVSLPRAAVFRPAIVAALSQFDTSHERECSGATRLAGHSFIQKTFFVDDPISHSFSLDRGRDCRLDLLLQFRETRYSLELLATAGRREIDDHFKRAAHYGAVLEADPWMVHFTMSSFREVFLQQPPPNLNVVVIQHDRAWRAFCAYYVRSGDTQWKQKNF